VPFISESIYRNLVANVAPDAPESVHLARWPQVNEALIDEKLVADTQVLLRMVSLGRAARKTASVKVRQPLGELWVRAATPAEAEGLRRFEDELRDELNIKQVRYMDASTDFVEYRCKPNLRLVGKKYGKQVPAITSVLSDLSSAAARAAAHAVEAGQPVPLVVNDQKVELQPDEVLIETSSPEGYAVAEGEGSLVALNTTVTPELRLEGIARDLVRNIQDARKNAGLEISDRIALYLDSSGDGGADTLAGVVQQWGDYIRNETLATDLTSGAAPDGAHTETVDFDDVQVRVGIVRQ
jgi:isoleucyl-tRNA synthetase